MTVDSAFKNIKRGQSNFLIWRVENFELKPVPISRYGNFYEGDSYIVYSAFPVNQTSRVSWITFF